MAILLPYFGIALAALIACSLTLGGHWAHKVSEQIRLDALTLSICHHRKNFIEFEILRHNRTIAKIQTAMDALAVPCISAILTAVAAPAVCEGVRKELSQLARAGKRMEEFQNAARVRYLEVQLKLKDHLVRDNHLDSTAGDLHFELYSDDGFSREEQPAYRKTLEAYFGFEWPKRLEPNSLFPSVNKFHSEFRPNRILVGVAENPREWVGVKNFRHRNLGSQSAKSKSACEIVNASGEEYEVKRIL